eukprot:3627043-Prymnesium_polylepis.1
MLGNHAAAENSHKRFALPAPALPARAATARGCRLLFRPDERVLHARHRRLRRDEPGVTDITLLLCLVEARAERKPTPVQRGVQRGSTPPSLGSCASLEPEPEDCVDGL